jgi:GMP synthase-like glutamine amidotransferase
MMIRPLGGSRELKGNNASMTGPWTILQHVQWEGPVLIASEAQRRGVHADIRRLDLGAGFPRSDEVGGLVVMGGPMGAYEAEKHPFLAAECDLIAELVGQDRPVLGVCLGAQLLARALGAKVFRGHGPEIGFGFVELTTAGKRDPLFRSSGPSVPVFHWHGDTFDLPEGSTLLASSTEYPHQAFRFGRCAYGLQFHIEPDSDTWSAWRAHLPLDLTERAEQRRYAVEQVGRSILARFLDVALGRGLGIERKREA